MRHELWDRWRLYADHLYRNPETKREFEKDYGDWYRDKFGFEPDLELANRSFFNIWSAYRMGQEQR